MSAREEALALLRDRFGSAWMPSIIFDDVLAGVRLGWRCDMHHIATGATFQGTYNGESELAAARACIAAWDEATKELGGKAAAYDDTHRGGWLDRAHAIAQSAGVGAIGRNVWHVTVEAADAERALADRLAEALKAVLKLKREKVVGIEAASNSEASVHNAWDALAAHSERRKA